MFVKLTSSGGHRYVQLVESFRDEEGRPRQRTVATLGRADRFEQVDKLIDGLRRATGRDPLAAPAVQFESALALGHVWALSELWRQLGLDALGPVMLTCSRFFEPIIPGGRLGWGGFDVAA